MTISVRLVAAGLAMVVVLDAGLTAQQRDATDRPRTGTASVSGVVVTNESTPQPVRRAVVSLFGGNSALGRHAITDDEGRFVFENLPAGRYSLEASKRSFVTIPFGAVRAGQPGAPLIVGEGQRLDNTRLQLARGAAITGTVREATGEPVAGLDVRVEAKSAIGTARPFALVAQTDDQGVYRAFGLPAGAYFVSTRARTSGRADMVAPSDTEVDAALRDLQTKRVTDAQPIASNPLLRNVASSVPARPVGFAPVFHPSVFTREEAALITVGAGEERAGVDVVVRMITTSAVTGQILNVGQRAPSEIEITLNKSGQTGPPEGALRTIARPDASFRLAGVAPGRYLLVARALSASLYGASLGKPGDAGASAGSPSSCAFAAEEIQVTGDDVAGVTVALRPCLRIDGSINVAPGVERPGAGSTFSGAVVSLQPVAGSGVPMYVPIRVPATISNDGRFVLGEFGDVLPGTYHVAMTLPAGATDAGWQVASGVVDGRDVLDSPLRIAADQASPISLALTVTNRRTSLAGSLAPAAGRLPSEYTIVAFPVNREWWSAPFRRVKAARASSDGQYQIRDLPPGEYFLAALSDLAPDEWRDREFLALIVPAAVRVTLGEGEQKVQPLKIGGR